MPLRLIAGPANAGKVELLLDRYLDVLDSRNGLEPVLIVPNRADVDRVELELLAAVRRCWAARSARSTTSFAGSQRGPRTLAGSSDAWSRRSSSAGS